MSRKDYTLPICGPVVLHSKVKGKIEKFTKQQKNNKRLGKKKQKRSVTSRVDPRNIICVIVSYRKVKVETGKCTEKSENQQNVTTIFSGEETHKMHLLCYLEFDYSNVF